MSRVDVVEIRLTSYGTGETRTIARLVLLEDGRLEVVGLTPSGRATVEAFITGPGVHAPDGRHLTVADGAELLRHAFLAARGPLFVASEPFEMERDAALTPGR